MPKSAFEECIVGLTTGFTPVVGADFSFDDYLPLDLSENNHELTDEVLSSSKAFENYLFSLLKQKGKKVAYGGYDEKRKLYLRSALFSEVKDPQLRRNTHLGVDLWAAAGTGVHAVLPGRIHSFRDNNNFGDYGPTIILEHDCKEEKFYSLYGHLSRSSLTLLTPGQEVEKGQKIAVLGTALENGDYAPHLHFQLIRDLQGQKGDFPGVCSQQEREKYLSNCPNPDLLLKLKK